MFTFNQIDSILDYTEKRLPVLVEDSDGHIVPCGSVSIIHDSSGQKAILLLNESHPGFSEAFAKDEDDLDLSPPIAAPPAEGGEALA